MLVAAPYTEVRACIVRFVLQFLISVWVPNIFLYTFCIDVFRSDGGAVSAPWDYLCLIPFNSSVQ